MLCRIRALFAAIALSFLSRDANSHDMYYRGLSDCFRSHLRIGCETVCDELRDWTWCRTIDISIRRGEALGCEVGRMSLDSSAEEQASVDHS